MKRRVVITGLGVVSPIGNTVGEFEPALREGRTGEGPITRFPVEKFPIKRACEVKGFQPPASAKRLDPFIQYALAATAEALQDSGVRTGEWDPFEIGVVMSSSKGGLTTFSAAAERLGSITSSAPPRALLAARVYSSFLPNFASQWIARQYGIKGPAACYVTACATGTYSVIAAAELIRRGDVKICIAGASDSSIVPLALGGYRQMGVYSASHMRPFDRTRDGFLVGEGAACLILEPREQAAARGAKIYCEIGAHACGNDGYSMIGFDPNGESLKRSIALALQREGIRPGEVDYVNLHGTATPEGDIYEAVQLRKLFGAELPRVPLSATKSMTGHMLGASGAVEILATAIALARGFIPPTANLETPDEQFSDLDLVRPRSREAEIRRALTYSLGFGGHICSMILKRYED